MPGSQLNSSGRAAAVKGAPYRARRAPLNHSVSGNFNLNSSYPWTKEKKNNGRKINRTPRSTAELSQQTVLEDSDSDSLAHDPERELLAQLVDPLKSCSRQRLRSLQMALRRQGTDESRMTAKELVVILQQNEIHISHRNLEMLCDLFEDQIGIDYERMWRLLVEAQAQTGRDSVVQISVHNDFSIKKNVVSRDKRDQDLIRRLEEQLTRSHDPLDLHQLRATLQVRDKNKIGRIDVAEVSLACNAVRLPIYGALLRALISRCNDVNSGLISWPEMLSYLEKAERNMIKKANVNESSNTPERKQNPIKPQPKPIKSKTNTSTSRPRTAHAHSTCSSTCTISKPSTSSTQNIPSTKQNPKITHNATKRPPTASTRSKGVTPVNQSTDRQRTQAEPSNLSKPNPDSQSAQKQKTTSQSSETKTQMYDKKLNSEPSQKQFDRHLTQKHASDIDDKKVDNNLINEVKHERNLTPVESNEAEPNTRVSSRLAGKTDQCPSRALSQSVNQNVELETNKKGGVKDAELSVNVQPTRIDTGTDEPKQFVVPVIQVESVADQSQMDTSRSHVTSPSANPKPDLLLDVERPSPAHSTHLTAAHAAHLRTHHTHPIRLDIRGKTHEFWPPDENHESNAEPPQERLQLEWVYGYRGNDCRSNIYTLASGEVVYFIGCVVVMYDVTSHSQRHYREHTQEIKSIAVHTNKNIVATGQNSSSSEKSDAHIRVWSADNLETMHVLGVGYFRKSVTALSFSREKDLLAAVDQGSDKVMSIWDARIGQRISQCTLEAEVVCDVAFNPLSTDVLVTVGREHLAWWKVFPETRTTDLYAKPDYENNLRARFVICMTHNDKGDLITGDSNGTVYIWGYKGNTITNFIKHAHEGPVFSLLLTRNYLLTAARDGYVRTWLCNKTMDFAGEIKVPPSEGAVRMLQQYHDNLLLGTTTNSILTTTIAKHSAPLTDAVINKQFLTQGHFDTVSGVGVAASPAAAPMFLTGGLDGIVSVNNAASRKAVWKYVLKNTCISNVDISYAGDLVAIATKDGRVVVLAVECHQDEEENSFHITEEADIIVSKHHLTSVRISADNKHIAVGDVEGYITIVTRLDDEDGKPCWAVEISQKCHEQALQTLAWSITKYGNDDVIQSTSKDLQLAFWNASTLSPVDAFLMRNMRWLLSHSTLSLQVAGVWSSKQAKECDIMDAHVSPSMSLVAIGDSHGYLSIFKFPCRHHGAFSHTYKSHPAVHGLSFTNNGRYLITVGGADCCVMQWKLV